MKTIKNTIILLIFGVICGNIYSQPTNTHAFVQDPGVLKGNVTSTAYTLSEIDVYNYPNTSTPSFISAFTYDDGSYTFLNFRRSKPCLGEYKNYYNIALSPGSGSLTVTDVKEVKATGSQEIVFCGSNNGQTGYIGMLDINLNPMGDINGYENVKYLYSIVEVPGYGFIACGEGHNGNGVVIAVDYGLNLISSNEDTRFIFTDVEYNEQDDCVYMAGYSSAYVELPSNELCVLGIDHRQMYNRAPNPCFDGFVYIDPNFNIEWNKNGKDDIKIISLGNKTVALAASGVSGRTRRNLCIFHMNTIDGGNPMHNIYYDIHDKSTYFKEFVNFGDTYNLLLQEEGSDNPVIVEMNPWQGQGGWDAMRITESVNPDMQMFKREGCQMLEILTSNNDVMNYSDCHSQVVGINHQPIEQPEHFPVRSMQATTYKYTMLQPFVVHHNPNLLQMQPGMNTNIGPTTYYQGDCHDDCMGLPTQTSTHKNTHAFIQEPADVLNGNLISTAYGLSELDLYCNSTGSPSFISAFTYEDNPAGDSYLHFRRTDPCLEEHENYYYVVSNAGIASNGNPDAAFRVTDVKEVKNRTGDFEIVFCGSYANEVAYIGMLDRNLNPIVDIIGYDNTASFNSIIEVPGFGFIACGEGHNNNGVVVAVDYDLNIKSSYEYDGFIFTDMDTYQGDPFAVFIAGYSPDELCAFIINSQAMYNGISNPSHGGFLYSDPNFDIEWNKSGKDDIKIISIDNSNKTIALAASGESRTTGQNLGIFYVGDIYGNRSTHNIRYDIHGNNTYFKEFVNFGDTYNLLLQEGGSDHPFIVQMDPNQWQNGWDAMEIMTEVNPDMQMFKREECQMLEILTSKDDMVNYSDCSSQVVGIDYQPIEHYEHFAVTIMSTDNIYQHDPVFQPLNVSHNPLLAMQPGINSHINPTTWYQGDCHEDCMGSVPPPQTSTNTNTHAFIQEPAEVLNGNVKSTAYALSELDLYCNNTGSPSFISAFTYNYNPTGNFTDTLYTYLHFRRTDPCLEEYENYYNVAEVTGSSAFPVGAGPLEVTDVKEVKNRTGNFEIVFCGGHNGREAYIGMLDKDLNLIGDINGYRNVSRFNSIVEVPGYGFIACGGRVVIAVDYNLNLISSYASVSAGVRPNVRAAYTFTDLEYDMADDCVYMAGYSGNELCVLGIDYHGMYNGVPNPCFDGFSYSDPNFNIGWGKISIRDDIKILSLGDKTVALAASVANRITGQNLGIFHMNTIDGGNPMHNIYYDINGSNIYFKEFVNFEDTYNLLLQEEGSNNPVIVEMNPWQGQGYWDAMRITESVNPDMQMFKREDCQMLEILTSKNDEMIYSDCSSQVVGIDYQPIEHYKRLTVNSMPANTTNINQNLNPTLGSFNVVHNPHFLPMNLGMNSHINPTVLYRGDCHEYCMRSAVAENDGIFENWNEDINPDSENNSVMIYGNIIELQDVANYSDYQIFDIMGRLVVKSKVDRNMISTSGIPNGTYIIHLSKTSGEVEHYKFIRQ